ncbi:MAG TPA: DUF507 family protein [Geobacteraceae bacterium]|nr:DUF507 family protein [Geobacteraceae bacterium]
MRLKDEQIDRLADRILTDLTDASLVVLRGDRSRLCCCIKEVIRADIAAEERLEKDAEELLEKTLRASGGGAGIDRHKMLKMIKAKLAKERKIVL